MIIKPSNEFKPVNYVSAITGKTYTMPGFYKKSWNSEKVCNSETAELVYTWLEGGHGASWKRVNVYRRPRGAVREFTITRWICDGHGDGYGGVYDVKPENFDRDAAHATAYNDGGWKGLFTIPANLPKFGGRVPKNIGLPHVREWRINTAVTKSIARHARKVNRAAILDANRAVKRTIAATRKHQPERPEQLKFDLAV